MSARSRWRQLALLMSCATVVFAAGEGAAAQARNQSPPAPAGNQSPVAPVTQQKPAPTPAIPAGVATPADYVIGPDDILTIVLWREKDLSGDVQVRPDGRITLPLVNEVAAAGLTPEQLRMSLTQALAKYLEEPTVTVIVKQINSRRVFITGQVAKPGMYPLMGETNVMQLITLAGGVLEYADGSNIGILRTVNGKPTRLRFNYKDVARGRKLEQNIALEPGDTIVVP